MLDATPLETQLWVGISALIAAFFATPFIGGYKSLLLGTRWYIHILRAGCAATSMWFTANALNSISLTAFYAIIFMAPLWTSLLARLLFKEELNLRRLVCLLIGFAGVLIIVQPGSNVDPVGALFTLGSSFFFALMSLTNKAFPASDPRAPFALYPALFACALFAVMWFTSGNAATALKLPSLSTGSLLLCGLTGLGMISGMILLSYAFQLTPAAVAAPYHYSQMIWGMMFGVIFFGEWPGPWSILGGALIIGSGLYLYLRQSKPIIPEEPLK